MCYDLAMETRMCYDLAMETRTGTISTKQSSPSLFAEGHHAAVTQMTPALRNLSTPCQTTGDIQMDLAWCRVLTNRPQGGSRWVRPIH